MALGCQNNWAWEIYFFRNVQHYISEMSDITFQKCPTLHFRNVRHYISEMSDITFQKEPQSLKRYHNKRHVTTNVYSRSQRVKRRKMSAAVNSGDISEYAALQDNMTSTGSPCLTYGLAVCSELQLERQPPPPPPPRVINVRVRFTKGSGVYVWACVCACACVRECVRENIPPPPIFHF